MNEYMAWVRANAPDILDMGISTCGGLTKCTCLKNTKPYFGDKDTFEWLPSKPPFTDMRELVCGFYGAMAYTLTNPTERNKATYAQMCHEWAEHVARLIFAACVGEARYDVAGALHGYSHWMAQHGYTTSDFVLLRRQPWVRALAYREHYGRTEARDGVAEYLPWHTQPEMRLDVLRTLRNIFIWCARFYRGERTSFGGLRWAGAVQLLHDRASGKLSDEMFIDHAINTYHNGAQVLSKFLYVNNEEYWLSARAAADAPWLIRWMPNFVRRMFDLPEAGVLPMDHEILRHAGVVPEWLSGGHAYYYVWSSRRLNPDAPRLSIYSDRPTSVPFEELLTRPVFQNVCVCSHCSSNGDHWHDCSPCKETCPCRYPNRYASEWSDDGTYSDGLHDAEDDEDYDEDYDEDEEGYDENEEQYFPGTCNCEDCKPTVKGRSDD